MKLFKFYILIFFGFLLAGWSSHYEEIADIKNYPQNALFYVNKSASKTRIISATNQSHLYSEYETNYFAPWKRMQPGHPKDDAKWSFSEFKNQTGYDETKKEWQEDRINTIEANANIDAYPNKKLRAITTRDTPLRMLPTVKPFFYSFDLEGEGFPFDNFQHSNLAANTPVYVSHVTKDGVWALVENHYGLGWVQAQDLAFVTQSFIDLWENGKYATLTRDNISLWSLAGNFLLKVGIGSQFPIVGETKTDYIILVARADVGQMAKILKAKLPKKASAIMPVPLTLHNLGAIMNQLIGKPYGWGGIYGNRDCSSVTKDFFMPFGIYLPRNSSDQVEYGRSTLDIEKYSNAEKKKIITKKGIPFLTLLWMKGHIMIYIGTYQGEPMVFHSFWGIRTADFFDDNGRHLVAKGAITTLEAGKELENRNPKSDLLSKTQKMTFLID